MLKVTHPKTNETIELNQFWLRDHCRCEKCYNQKTKQRAYNILDIPENIQCLKVDTTTTVNQFKVQWHDGHVSNYDYDFLFNSQNYYIANTIKKVLWNAKDISDTYFKDINFQLTDLITPDSDSVVKNVVEALVHYGIALINGLPANATITEMTVRNLFPIMKTLFGEMYTFSDSLDHADTAYSKEYLSAHTDNTYFCDAAGLQIFHCLEHINGTGGENFFVDGIKAALLLKDSNPDAYNRLCKVLVPAEYIENGEHHYYSAPIIRTDPLTEEIVQIRLNVYDRAVFNTLPQHEMQAFYTSYREYLKIIDNTENQWLLKLNSNTMIIIDNWRILHGRKAYTGHRTMCGGYVQRTDFMSRARIRCCCPNMSLNAPCRNETFSKKISNTNKRRT